MEDGEKNTNMERSTTRQPFSNIFNASTILQSLWIRCRTIFPDITDRKFMESESRFVFYCGFIFWIVYLLSKAL
jgi:hypothetical protein